MKAATYRCLVSEAAATLILRAFQTCQQHGELEDVSEVLRMIRVQHPDLESRFPDLPWPGRNGSPNV
jgi:hypothetical protein